ncbi:MAG: aminotransferase class III-fold pyridoxal phosphate-dependent enzyme, partial [Xanthomonadales bacterium]|nr:aminotransferase class III-fold pyridoxal phosphate-dependent enzyme [Xanthomonadales bacterium]
GATLGAVPAVEDYFSRIREICDRHDVLLILDEVMAGRGRTGAWFGFEQEAIRPDIVTVAKGLGGGYQAIGATICRPHIHDAIVEGSGFFEHGHTYIGHATACAAALAVARVIEQQQLLDAVQSTGQQLKHGLDALLTEHPRVGDIRGRGLFLGIELVADRTTRKPINGRLGLPARIKKEAMKNGLIVYPGGGTADGIDGAHVLLAPPFTYSASHVDELLNKLGRTLNGVSYE